MAIRTMMSALLVVACGQALAAPPSDELLRKGAPVVDRVSLLCLQQPARCPRFAHNITVPAHALSRSTFGTFDVHTRGVNWTGNTGAMSFTMRRPDDFTGTRVRLRFLFEITDDAGGDLQFVVTPVTLKHGGGFETYASYGTPLVAVPESPTIMQESTVIVTDTNGIDPDGPWWYFEINRQGTYAGRLRLYAVALEY